MKDASMPLSDNVASTLAVPSALFSLAQHTPTDNNVLLKDMANNATQQISDVPLMFLPNRANNGSVPQPGLEKLPLSSIETI